MSKPEWTIDIVGHMGLLRVLREKGPSEAFLLQPQKTLKFKTKESFFEI